MYLRFDIAKYGDRTVMDAKSPFYAINADVPPTPKSRTSDARINPASTDRFVRKEFSGFIGDMLTQLGESQKRFRLMIYSRLHHPSVLVRPNGITPSQRAPSESPW